MINIKSLIILLVLVIPMSIAGYMFYIQQNGTATSVQDALQDNKVGSMMSGLLGNREIHPLSIEALRERTYEGSEIVIEQELSAGSNYEMFLTSYQSEGLKIYSLLTVPTGTKPQDGWPVIIFNHGYIPPEQYSTTQRYEAYVDYFAGNGYVVFKPDYRGHGKSEGLPEGAYFSPSYTLDVLNAVSSVKKLSYVDPEKIGMWGHSMGGIITLKAMVATKDVKAGVIWAGVVGSYEDIFYNWHRKNAWKPSQREINSYRPSRQSFVEKYGEPKDNPEFWNALSATTYVSDISGPVQLHHGTNDGEVPIEFSQKLNDIMTKKGIQVEFYTYEGADHNLSGNAFGTAMKRSVVFFDKYLK